MKFLRQMTIKKKLWSGAMVLLFLFFLNALFSYYYAVKTGKFMDPAKVTNIKNTDILKRHLKEIVQAFSDAVTTGEDDYLDKVKKEAAGFRIILKSLKKEDPGEMQHLLEIENKFDTYVITASKTAQILLKEDLSSRELTPLAEKVKEVLPQLRDEIDGLINKKYDDFLEILRQTENISKRHISTDLSLAFIVLIICIFAAPFIIRSIIEPINELVEATEKLGEGKLDTRAKVISNDEIGVLAQSFNFMTESLQEKNKTLQATTNHLKNLLKERTKMESEIRIANKELRKANEQLKQVDRHKSEFLASMSHELRTPLNAIINFTDQIIEDWADLKEDESWYDEAKDMLVRVLKSSRHLLSLINDLLDLAKIESGKMKLDFDETDISVLVLDTLENVRSLANSKKINLKAEIPENFPNCFCDERKIRQVLINLLSNAIKFTNEGEILVKALLPDNFKEGMRIDVIDSGEGIPENSLDIIFDRFRQVDGSDSRKYQGTGLGLNLVKEIMKMHEGHVEVKSVPGKGSCFSIYLPFNTDKCEEDDIKTDYKPVRLEKV